MRRHRDPKINWRNFSDKSDEMKLTVLGMLLALPTVQAAAAGIVRVADGDCAALGAAINAPAGRAPSTIVLAAHGSYDCWISVAPPANVVIDGAGAHFGAWSGALGSSSIDVNEGASLTLRNLNIAPPAQPTSTTLKVNGPPPKPDFPVIFGPPISNSGTLTLESVSMTNVSYFPTGVSVSGPSAIIDNNGSFTLRNTTLAANVGTLIENFGGGDVQIVHSTLANNQPLDGALNPLALENDAGTLRIANSILATNTEANCGGRVSATSLGGNTISDKSCAFDAAHDHFVTDPHLGTFDTHGGIVNAFALSYDSPAIGSGLAANCEAADARGAARGQTQCDSGAYEFGGGEGKLGVSGASGLYFNSQNNGHYVTVQRVFDDNALVIWNTFDENGKPAWVYGVGAVNGGHIHVDQVAENLGGVLRPGGAVDGAKPTLWGGLELNVGDCHSATLNYDSVLPHFGSGTVNLERLAFVTGLDCSP